MVKVKLRLILAVLVLAGLAPFGQAQAQVVRGHILETVSAREVASASVMLLDTAFAVVESTMSNPTGAFQLECPGPGDYYVLVEALGYHPSIDGILEMGENGSINIEFYIRPKPLELDSLVVAVQRVRAHRVLESSGYYERERKGFGHFVTPEKIEKENPRYLQDLFNGIPGVHLDWGGGMGSEIVIMKPGPGGAYCSPSTYVNGMRVDTGLGGLESVVDIDQIAAVEAYTRASAIPIQYSGSNGACGVVLIWTK